MNAGCRLHAFHVYGVHVTSDRPFDLPPISATSHPVTEVAFREGVAADVAQVPVEARRPEPWFTALTLDDGSMYVRWGELGEVMVAPDGSQVTHRPLAAGDERVFERFLFGQALSFALVRQGFEPLHAAVIAIDGAAVALVGDCTFGKSTLAAAFVKAGYRLLTDDLLLIDRRGGQFLACPGTGRLKLQADSASAFLGQRDGIPLHAASTKQTFQLAATEVQRTPLPLCQMLMLPDPAERDTARAIDISRLPRAAACHRLLKNSFNVEILDANRVARQFAFAADLASGVDAYAIRYPPGLDRVAAVRHALISSVNQTVVEAVSS